MQGNYNQDSTQINQPNTKLKETIEPEDEQLEHRESTIVKETCRTVPDMNFWFSTKQIYHQNHMKLESSQGTCKLNTTIACF